MGIDLTMCVVTAVAPPEHPHYPGVRVESLLVAAELDWLEQLGFDEPAPCDHLWVVHPLNAVAKGPGTMRFVMDFTASGVNTAILRLLMQLPRVRDAIRPLRPRDFMFKVYCVRWVLPSSGVR